MRALGTDAAGRAMLNYRFHRRIYELADSTLSLRFIDQLLRRRRERQRSRSPSPTPLTDPSDSGASSTLETLVLQIPPRPWVVKAPKAAGAFTTTR